MTYHALLTFDVSGESARKVNYFLKSALSARGWQDLSSGRSYYKKYSKTPTLPEAKMTARTEMLTAWEDAKAKSEDISRILLDANLLVSELEPEIISVD